MEEKNRLREEELVEVRGGDGLAIAPMSTAGKKTMEERKILSEDELDIVRGGAWRPTVTASDISDKYDKTANDNWHVEFIAGLEEGTVSRETSIGGGRHGR